MSERKSGNHRMYSYFLLLQWYFSRFFGECLCGISYTCELSLTETLLFSNTFQSKTSFFLVFVSQNIAEDKICTKRRWIQICQNAEFYTWHSSVFLSSANIYSKTAFEISFVCIEYIYSLLHWKVIPLQDGDGTLYSLSVAHNLFMEPTKRLCHLVCCVY